MTRFVIDPPTLVRLARERIDVSPDHRLVAPNSLRSGALEILLGEVRSGALTDREALGLHDRITEVKVRLLGDRVSRRVAWDIAREHDWDTLAMAEYLAVARAPGGRAGDRRPRTGAPGRRRGAGRPPRRSRGLAHRSRGLGGRPGTGGDPRAQRSGSDSAPIGTGPRGRRVAGREGFVELLVEFAVPGGPPLVGDRVTGIPRGGRRIGGHGGRVGFGGIWSGSGHLRPVPGGDHRKRPWELGGGRWPGSRV